VDKNDKIVNRKVSKIANDNIGVRTLKRKSTKQSSALTFGVIRFISIISILTVNMLGKKSKR